MPARSAPGWQAAARRRRRSSSVSESWRTAGRLVAQVVAAEIGRDGAETGCEGRDLVPPRVPALRKAVQQDDERPVAVDRAVEIDAVGRDGAVLEGHRGPA